VLGLNVLLCKEVLDTLSCSCALSILVQVSWYSIGKLQIRNQGPLTFDLTFSISNAFDTANYHFAVY
jgi:hypothetical protein